MTLGRWRAHHTALLAALAIAGCGGESAKTALGALPPATRQLQLATAPVDQLIDFRADPLPRIQTELGGRLSERVIAALYGELGCMTEASQQAAAAGRAKQLPAAERNRFKPPEVLSAESTLEKARDLAQALVSCVQEEAAQRVLEAVEARIKTTAKSLVHRLDDYLTASATPLHKDLRAEIDDDGSVIDRDLR